MFDVTVDFLCFGFHLTVYSVIFKFKLCRCLFLYTLFFDITLYFYFKKLFFLKTFSKINSTTKQTLYNKFKAVQIQGNKYNKCSNPQKGSVVCKGGVDTRST